VLSHRRGSSAARWSSRHRSVVVAALLLLLAIPGMSMPARAESPGPTVIGSGDPRSEGEGAGLVGDPLLVAFGVVALGALASGATLVFLRLTHDE
jgi:hypothetical protein